MSSPAAVFHRRGLRTRGIRGLLPGPSGFEGQSPAARFRDALEELGGLYASFGQFLAWRSDLLRVEYVSALRNLRASFDPIPRGEALDTVRHCLGDAAGAIASSLEETPCWSTASRCAWKARWRDRDVAIQLCRPPASDKDFDRLQRGLCALEEEGVARVLDHQAVQQFRDWMRLGDDPARERSYLEVLAGFRQDTLVEFPRLIPELCGGPVLGWEWVEGEPLARAVGDGSPQAARKIAEAVLEQICLFSVIDGDLDLEAIVETPKGKIALRRANRLLSVPPAQVRPVLKYIAAVISENSPDAAHFLLKMNHGSSEPSAETRLMNALSSLQPELKMSLRYPASAAIFEGNWRALTSVAERKPLYLDCMHRNLVAAGYWNAECAGTSERTDFLAEGQWPVVGRLLRARSGELLSPQTINEYLTGSGLLLFEGLRQVSRLADGFQTNDLSFSVKAGLTERGQAQANRVLRWTVATAFWVFAFLLSVKFGSAASGVWADALFGVASVAAVGVFWMLLRAGSN